MPSLFAPLSAWIARTLPEAGPEERARAMVLVVLCAMAPAMTVLYVVAVPMTLTDTGRWITIVGALLFVCAAPVVLRFTRSLDWALVPVVLAASTPVVVRLAIGDPRTIDSLLWMIVLPVVGALIGRGVGFAASIAAPVALACGVYVAHSQGWVVNGERLGAGAAAASYGLTALVIGGLLIAYRSSVRAARARLEQANQDLEKARGAAAQADRLATVGALATGVAHGVNNPLQAALEGVRELEGLLEGEPGSPTNRARGVTAEIGVALHQIRATVAALATFADPVQQGHGDPVSLDELVRQVVGVVRGSAGESAEIRIRTDQLPAVYGHRNELAQALLVLLRNAAQAVDPARAPVSIDVMGGCTPDGDVYIEVRDDGLGMTDDVLERIFEPFFTTRNVGEGAGLGLPLARNVMRHLGGTIDVRSREGMGTLARIVLPASLIAEPTDQGDATTVPAGARILVVDDEPLPLRVVGRALTPLFEVELELSPERALHRLRQGEPFDLVVSDLMMPGMTGDQLYARTVEIRPDLAERFVFITGAVLDGDAQARVRASRVVVIQKPFDRDELVRVVSARILAARTVRTASGGDTPTPTRH